MPPEADEGLREIEHWGCDVLVTTRFPLGDGFRNIAVPLLSEEASRALFVQHDPYLKSMGSAETEALHQVAFARGGASAGNYPAGASGEDEALDDASAAGRA